MTDYTPTKLSGSTDGLPIKVAATATPGTLIHTADASADDYVTLWAFNSDSVARLLTVEFGGVTDPDHIIEKSIPAQSGLKLVLPGIPITNSKVVRAFAAAANVVTIVGSVNRVS